MSRRGSGVRALQKQHVAAREQIERAWSGAIETDATFADLVTGETARDEPYHRWLPFRQQFGPGLVRRFLEAERPADPVLDPFSGSGTVVIECARAGRAAIGVEAVPVLAHLARARFDAHDDARLADVLFAGRTVAGDGRRKAAAPPEEVLADIRVAIAEDRAKPLRAEPLIVVGDARRLPLADGSVGGIVTSPPYLSRYDYTRITSALDAAWRGSVPAAARGAPQVRATLRAKSPPRARSGGAPLPAAAREAVEAVRMRGRRRDADVVRAYFHDLVCFIREIFRVARAGAPAWVVLGAADFEREYVPADLIAAEIAHAEGFEVAGIVEARRLRESGRMLGDLRDVAPRESILRLRKLLA